MRLENSVWIPAPRLRGDKLRGNDIFNASAVIPAQAGIHILDNRSLALRLTL